MLFERAGKAVVQTCPIRWALPVLVLLFGTEHQVASMALVQGLTSKVHSG